VIVETPTDQTNSVQTFTIPFRDRELRLQRVCSGYYRGGDALFAERCLEATDQSLEQMGFQVERVKRMLLRLRIPGSTLVISIYRGGQIIIDFAGPDQPRCIEQICRLEETFGETLS